MYKTILNIFKWMKLNTNKLINVQKKSENLERQIKSNACPGRYGHRDYVPGVSTHGLYMFGPFLQTRMGKQTYTYCNLKITQVFSIQFSCWWGYRWDTLLLVIRMWPFRMTEFLYKESKIKVKSEFGHFNKRKFYITSLWKLNSLRKFLVNET